ncbi:MAG: sensor protein [Gemmatimonadetes bacterium]|nr:sensor protein [Gemmatimonadota bacterium]
MTPPDRSTGGGLVGLSMRAITSTLHRLFRSRLAADRLRAEQAAADTASRMKREFVESMSHELRTPLNAIIGLSNILLKNSAGTLGEKELNYISRIAVNGEHLLKLIDDILSFARLDAGRTYFHMRTISAPELLSSVETLVTPLAQAKGITYSVRPVDDSVCVVADEERARHVLLNLVTNAIKFTPEAGHVSVSCEVRDGWANIDVRDDGRGIPGGMLSTIFEPFTQVGRALNQPAVGIGLGLAISRDLARAMGGDIDVVSAEGQGSTFTLRLPHLAAAAVPRGASDGASDGRQSRP